MTNGLFTRRDVLKASAGRGSDRRGMLGLRTRGRRRRSRRAVTPALIEAAQKEGKVVWYAAMDLPVSERVARGFEAKLSRHCGAHRAHRRGARSSSGWRRNTPPASTPPTSSTPRMPRISSPGSATAGSRPSCRRRWRNSSRPSIAIPTACSPPRASTSVSLGYNTNMVKPEDAPESSCRPARSEMAGQDRQGASGLQRHDHDRDLPDRA